jgi:diadenylate cyclase
MLAARRVGAIIALERQIGLRNYIEGGIPLDALLTYDLLVSIFQPTSPLHDGAVIVQDDRIAAAACFLPLTVNPKLSKELGSRHRAAIGLTEENDSVAIAVSEETGGISLVADGQIERGLDAGACGRACARWCSGVSVRKPRVHTVTPSPFATSA